MYSIDYTHQFKKDLRKCAKRGLDIDAIKHAIKILSATGTLPEEYRPHQLKGDHKWQWWNTNPDFNRHFNDEKDGGDDIVYVWTEKNTVKSARYSKIIA